MADAERTIEALAAGVGSAPQHAAAELRALRAVLEGEAAASFDLDPHAFARVLVAPLPLADAVRAAAGRVAPGPSVVGEAVAEAAGRVDVVEAVFASLMLDDGWSPVQLGLRDAVAALRVDVVDAVLAEVAPSVDLQGAIAQAAGRADVADAVMASLARVGVSASPSEPAPVINRGWRWLTGLSGMSGLAAAAISLIWVPAWIGPDPLMMAEVAAAIEAAGPAPLPVMDAAHAGEVNVDEIATAGNAAVFVEVPSTDDAAMIIWVTEGGA